MMAIFFLMFSAVPHSLYNEDNEGCLIIDGDKKKFKEYREQHKSEFPSVIKKILTTTKLSKEFKSFESRRKLVNSYDFFLVDKRVYHKMANLLGREFFKKKK